MEIVNSKFNNFASILTFGSNVLIDGVTIDQGYVIAFPSPDNRMLSLNLQNSTIISSRIFAKEINNVNVINTNFQYNLQQSLYYRYFKTFRNPLVVDIVGEYMEADGSALSISSLVASSATISNSVFTKMKQYGAVYLKGVGITAHVTNSTFEDNKSEKGGAGICLDTIYMATIDTSKFINNLQMSMFDEMNGDTVGGGAIYQIRSLMTTNNCYFYNNYASSTGGAVFSYLSYRYTSQDDVRFSLSIYSPILTVVYSKLCQVWRCIGNSIFQSKYHSDHQ